MICVLEAAVAVRFDGAVGATVSGVAAVAMFENGLEDRQTIVGQGRAVRSGEAANCFDGNGGAGAGCRTTGRREGKGFNKPSSAESHCFHV